jgi:hypothetical protein
MVEALGGWQCWREAVLDMWQCWREAVLERGSAGWVIIITIIIITIIITILLLYWLYSIRF